MRTRIASLLTGLLLLAGTSGAIALGSGGPAGSIQGGASTAQYKPGKGCGKPGEHQRGGECKPKHKSSVKAVKRRRKKAPRSSNCKFRVIGQTLIAYCPLS